MRSSGGGQKATSVDADDVRIQRRTQFLEYVALQYDYALSWAEKELEGGADPAGVVREALYMCLHNVFVVIDGGTGMDDRFSVGLFDHDGNELGPALHEWFVDHLFNTERMR